MSTELQEPRAYGKGTKGTGPEIPEIDDDNYRAVVKDIKQSQSTYDGKTNEQYVVEWELLDETRANGEPLTLRSYITIPEAVIRDGTVNEKSKLYEFLMALGYTDDNLVIDPSEWQGEEARIVVINKEITSGDNKGQVRPRVTGYLAPKRGKNGAKPSPAAAVAAKATDAGEDY